MKWWVENQSIGVQEITEEDISRNWVKIDIR